MNYKNLNNRPSIIVGLTILLLLGISFLPKDISMFGIEIKHIDILEDLRLNQEIEEKDSAASFNDHNRSINFASNSHLEYLLLLNEVENFIESEYDKFENTNVVKSPTFNNSPLEGNIEQLKFFFEALDSSKNSQVRVAHYGDSSLEGDLITGYLRNKFQQIFGGRGVGFLPITSEDITFRETTKIRFSDDWIVASISSSNADDLNVGIGGKMFLNSKDSWVKYETIPKFRSIRNFDVARLFYNNAKSNSVIQYSLNEGTDKSLSLLTGEGVQESRIEKNNSISLKLVFPQETLANFYGVSLEGKFGVYIDNLPLRGNSGIDLRNISNQTLEEFNSLLNYKLVILEFGLNILSGRKTNFSKYEAEMIKVIAELKTSFPHTSFLLIGVHDKCIKKKMDFITDPAITRLVQAQKRIAEKADVAFWNLFDAMGGENSMVRWVNANPPLAYSDYTHFTSIGTKEEAKMLFETLMNTKEQL